jgi:hypothetical protein
VGYLARGLATRDIANELSVSARDRIEAIFKKYAASAR